MRQNIDTLTTRFDESLFVLMQNLGPQLINRAHLGLTPGQVFTLHFIQQARLCNVSKLAEKMEVAPSAITVMLDRLESHGFVVRKRDKADRRVVLIELTDLGRAKLNEILDVRKQIMQHCLIQLNSTELRAFVETLEKLAVISREMDIGEITEPSSGER